MTTQWKCFDGTKHPVSDAFTAKVPADINGIPHTVLKAELNALLSISSADVLDGGRELTEKERARVEGITDVMNLNRALAFMGGRDYRDLFGPGATLDQVHGNAVHKECGCVLQHAFDHNRRHESGIEVHPHYSLNACRDHAHLKDDFRAHHKAFAKGA